MKRVIAVILACAILISVAFALPSGDSIMPRTGFFNSEVKVASGETWTSSRYEITGAYENVFISADLIKGSNVTVELYGANATSTNGVKVGSIAAGNSNVLKVKRNYAYYFFKVINNSSASATTVIMLYA
jgi:hypothetical protein